MKVEKVTIVGGTHGNEYTGPYLLKVIENRLQSFPYSTFEFNLLLSNPKAYTENKRFIDVDLNRSFFLEELSDLSLGSYEANRAKVINQLLGPKGGAETSLIIDIHTTTANMGVTVILVDNNTYNLKLASHIKSRVPNAFIYYISPEAFSGKKDNPFLNSLAKYGFALEIGPIANGIVRHDLLMQAYHATLACLEFIENTNNGTQTSDETEVEVYELVRSVGFPIGEDGDIEGVIHKDLQDMDYKPLKPGAPIFEKFNGEVVLNQEKEELFPVFINEAAYYEKNIAFSLTRKRMVAITD